MQKGLDEMLAAKDQATPPLAILVQHENGLKQLAWDKEQIEAQIQNAAETRVYWTEQEDEGKKHLDDIKKKTVLAETAKSDFWIICMLERFLHRARAEAGVLPPAPFCLSSR